VSPIVIRYAGGDLACTTLDDRAAGPATVLTDGGTGRAAAWPAASLDTEPPNRWQPWN
jgi:hypothetical protein